MFVTRSASPRSSTPLLSLCMIVRDAATTLPACLASIRPWVDELVVVDTGSRDDTPAIAASFGARVIHFPWIDDFAAARNVSLAHATGHWLLWMDADDTISPANGHRLRELAAAAHPDSILGFVMQVHCPAPDPSGGVSVTVVDHVKLLRHTPGLRFEGRIHEQVLPSLRALGGEIGWTDMFVEHSLVEHTAEARAKKLERDLRILALDLAERPGHPFVLFNLGMTHADAGDHEIAVDWLQQCLAVSRLEESHTRKAYALCVGSLMELNRLAQAGEICDQATAAYPDDAELAFRAGMLAHERGELAAAEQWYRRALRPPADLRFASYDRGLTGYKARHNLALVLQDAGQHHLAENQWRQALAERETSWAAWRGLGTALLAQGKVHAAEALVNDVAELVAEHPAGRATQALLEAEWLAATGSIDAALAGLEARLAEHPRESALRELQCRLLVLHERWSAAAAALETLVSLTPNDAAAWHNYGCVLAHTSQLRRAATALETSLRLRPAYPATLRELARLQPSLPEPALLAASAAE